LEELAGQEQVVYFRESEECVLAKLLETAQSHGLEYFTNITADCPIMEPLMIDRVVL